MVCTASYSNLTGLFVSLIEVFIGVFISLLRCLEGDPLFCVFNSTTVFVLIVFRTIVQFRFHNFFDRGFLLELLSALEEVHCCPLRMKYWNHGQRSVPMYCNCNKLQYAIEQAS